MIPGEKRLRGHRTFLNLQSARYLDTSKSSQFQAGAQPLEYVGENGSDVADSIDYGDTYRSNCCSGNNRNKSYNQCVFNHIGAGLFT